MNPKTVAKRMVRPLKEATVKSFHCETRADLEAHPRAYMAAYHLGEHLKGCARFKADPHHLVAGPNTPTLWRKELRSPFGKA